MVYRICVVGAGVIGLSTAFNIQDKIPETQVMIIADKFSPNTTADGTPGLFMPYLAEKTPLELIYKWGKTTRDYLLKILRSLEADAAGVSMHCATYMTDKNTEDPFWKELMFNFHTMKKSELELMFPGHENGWHFTTMFCMCKRYLPWLMQRYRNIGGRVIKQKLSSLSEISDLYDVIVVCPGIGARHLLNDQEVFPIRGEIVTMKTLWKNCCSVPDVGEVVTYLLPGTEYIHCGGAAQVNNWNDKSNPEDVKGIIERCTELVPSLKSAEIIDTWAGLRPGRSSIRLEQEDMVIAGKNKKVVYNYGHGGSGVTLHWGCALDATELVRQCIAELPMAKL